MISLTPIITLIKQAKPIGFERDWFRQVAGAAEFARLANEERITLPGCWVVRAADAVQPAGERAEDVALSFDVVIAVTNERMATAGDTDDMLLRYRKAVHTLLLGYELPAQAPALNAPLTHPVKFGGGQVIEYTDGDLWWRDRYSFDAHLTNYLPDPQAFSALTNTNSGVLR